MLYKHVVQNPSDYLEIISHHNTCIFLDNGSFIILYVNNDTFENPSGAGASGSDFENPSGAGASRSDFENPSGAERFDIYGCGPEDEIHCADVYSFPGEILLSTDLMKLLPHIVSVELIDGFNEPSAKLKTIPTNYDYSKIVTYLSDSGLICLQDTDHEFRGDSRDIMSVTGYPPLKYPISVESLAFHDDELRQHIMTLFHSTIQNLFRDA